FLFGNGSLDFLKSMNEQQILQVFDGIAQFEVSESEFAQGFDMPTLLAEKTKIFTSKGEAKKMIVGGGVSINKEKVNSPDLSSKELQPINNQFVVVQKGKKNYFLINLK